MMWVLWSLLFYKWSCRNQHLFYRWSSGSMTRVTELERGKARIWPQLYRLWGFPGGTSDKESAWQCQRHRFDPWVRKIPYSRRWQCTPVFLPGKFHWHSRLVGYNPWGRKESDTTEHAHTPLTLEPVHHCSLGLCRDPAWLKRKWGTWVNWLQ